MKNHRLSIALAIAFSISATVVAYGQGNQGGPANTPGTPSTPQNAPPNTPANRPGNQQPGTQPNTQPPATAPSNQSSSTTTAANTGSSAAAINEAIEMNMGEVALGRQAATKAQNSKVKNFANMIVKDHNEAIAKLRAISTTGSPTSSNTNTKPNADHQKVEDRLSKLSGAQYDQEFMNEMVTGHTKAVEFFEKHSGETSTASANSTRNTTSTNSTNTNSTTTNSTTTNSTRSTNTASTNTLASVSKELLPTVRMHLKEAQEIQRELQGNTAKPAAGTPNTTDSNRTTTPAPTR